MAETSFSGVENFVANIEERRQLSTLLRQSRKLIDEIE
jgi:hypothetical protein